MKLRNIYILFIAVALSLPSCKTDTSSGEEGIEELRPDDIQNIIRNPVSANAPLDTVNLPKLVFEETLYDFGTVNEGDKVKHTFAFTNEGPVALVISNATSTCGCTVPQWPKQPIQPGESGEINVVFDTQNKPNYQEKPISIIANTYPNKTVIKIKGQVKAKN